MAEPGVADPEPAPFEPDPLIALFRRCVVRIDGDDGRFRGTGFLVAPATIVTCAHVVHGQEALSVSWAGLPAAVGEVRADPPLAKVADARAYPLPDLAVLRLPDGAGFGDHPCVRLATASADDAPALGDALYYAGYSVEHASPALAGDTTELGSPITEESTTFHKLKRSQVLPGYSGSPLLDLRTRCVAGVIESTRGRHADLGGFAVTAASLAGAFPDVAEANAGFHRSDRRWADAVMAQAARVAQREGSRARLPLLPPTVKLDWSEERSPADALRPRHAVVPYVGRERLLTDIAAWCEAPDEVAVWFVTGGGGFGKTRLAVEACLDAERRGWMAGLLEAEASEAQTERLAEWPGPLLLAVDYAETRPDVVGRLVTQARRWGLRRPLRILALVRRRASRPDLVADFNRSREEGLAGVLYQAGLSRIEEREVDRLTLFDEGAEAFAGLLGREAGSRPRPRLRAGHFARPLYALVAAYLVAADADVDIDALDERDLLRRWLEEHEVRYWDRWAERRRLNIDPADQRVAVALATFLGAANEDEALAVAGLVPHVAETPEARVGIARWLADLYPPPPGSPAVAFGALEPDRLGEVLVADVLRARPALLALAVDGATDGQITRLLTVAARIAADDDAVRDLLRDVLDARLRDLLGRGLAGAGDLLEAVLSATAVSRPAAGALAAVDLFPVAVPVWALPIAADVTGLAVAGLRARSAGGEDINAELAGMLSNLGVRLATAGRREEALGPATEAVELRRDQARANPAAYAPDLAMALNNLANHLAEAGRREEALGPATEAVELRRDQARANPAAYAPDLASALNNLANRLAEAGRREEALGPATEAVELRRDQARANPAAYAPDLASALNNLAIRLAEAGRREEALGPATEAVELRRDQARANPAAYAPDLAMALNNLAIRLAEAGRREEALGPATEAVELYRDQARANPAAYAPDLAWPSTTWPTTWPRPAGGRRPWARPRRRWSCTGTRPGPTPRPTPPTWPWPSTPWPSAWPRPAGGRRPRPTSPLRLRTWPTARPGSGMWLSPGDGGGSMPARRPVPSPTSWPRSPPSTGRATSPGGATPAPLSGGCGPTAPSPSTGPGRLTRASCPSGYECP